MKRIRSVMAAGMLTLCGPALAAEPAPWNPPGPNLALNRPYTVSHAGKTLPYKATQDEGDATQLTDGQYAPSTITIWHHKPTVGWFMGTTGIAIDLGEMRSIGGLSFSTDSANGSGVGYPPAILILVSDDGQQYRLAGELIGLSTRFGPPPRQGRYRFRTDELKTRGRYVQVVVQSGLFVFCDEIEVYEGKPAYLDIPPSGTVVSDAAAYLRENIMPYAVSARLAADAARARTVVGALRASRRAKRKACAKLEALRQAALKPEMITYDPDFRAIAPMNALHAQILAAMSPAYRAARYPEFMVWTINRWARLSPFDGPAAPPTNGVTLAVRVAQNDRRGEVVSVANFSDAAKTAVVSVAGLPGGAKPAYLNVKQAEFVALHSRAWDADALPDAAAVKDGWTVTLPAGLSRQLWLDVQVKPGACPAGTHQGELVVKVDGGPELRVPLTLTVDDVVLPEQKAVSQGNWDFAHGGSRGDLDGRVVKGYGLSETNVDAAIAHMRASGVSVAWAHTQWSDKDIVPYWCKGMEFDEGDNLVKPPDYTTFDRWVKSRPEVRYLALYLAAGDTWQKAKMGTDTFNRRMSALTKHWVAHMREIGVDPSRIVLCIFDEPRFSSAAKIITAWAEPIRAAAPEFKFYTDPLFGPDSYGNPDVIRMLERMNIVTPGTDYGYHHYGKAAEDFYESVRAKGKIMGFYVCAQDPSEAESTRYYRLQQWACWKINGGGPESWTGFWSYSDTRGNQPWNQLPCGTDRNWSPVYIDSTSVTDGKHWLAIFEGVNDYEYLLTLKNRIAEVRQAGRNDETVAAAEKLLAELPDEVIAAGRANNTATCDVGRLRVLDALESLER